MLVNTNPWIQAWAYRNKTKKHRNAKCMPNELSNIRPKTRPFITHKCFKYCYGRIQEFAKREAGPSLSFISRPLRFPFPSPHYLWVIIGFSLCIVSSGENASNSNYVTYRNVLLFRSHKILTARHQIPRYEKEEGPEEIKRKLRVREGGLWVDRETRKTNTWYDMREGKWCLLCYSRRPSRIKK